MSREKKIYIYTISHILRSTALSMSTLPIFWLDYAGLSIGTFLFVMSIVPLISIALDLPLSGLADKIGLKTIYILGLTSM